MASGGAPISLAYYQRKHSEGQEHNTAVMCLTRRSCDVRYLMIENGTLCEESPRRFLPKSIGKPASKAQITRLYDFASLPLRSLVRSRLTAQPQERELRIYIGTIELPTFSTLIHTYQQHLIRPAPQKTYLIQVSTTLTRSALK